MVRLITSYWGSGDSEDLELRKIYVASLEALSMRYNRMVPGSLEVSDLSWLPSETLEHFLVRTRAANSYASSQQLDDLVELLLHEARQPSVGTGVAIYGLNSTIAADDLRNRTDSTRPRGLRFIAGEASVANFSRHLALWMEEAARAVIARASATSSEEMIADLARAGSSSASGQRWTFQ